MPLGAGNWGMGLTMITSTGLASLLICTLLVNPNGGSNLIHSGFEYIGWCCHDQNG